MLLPFDASASVDWPALDAHGARTATTGLPPAVNRDTGYVNLLDDAMKCAVLERTRNVLGRQSFVAGAFAGDAPGSRWNRDDYLQQDERPGCPESAWRYAYSGFTRLLYFSRILQALGREWNWTYGCNGLLRA